MARYAGRGLQRWIESTLEERMSLKINREKTKVVNLKTPDGALDFLGFRFQMRQCQWRKGHWYFHQQPSPKSRQKERDWLRDQTDSRQCFTPVKDLIARLNVHRRGWGNYFKKGHPRGPFKALNHFTRLRLINHLKRRSQRGYKKPRGVSWYAHLRGKRSA
jgi:RNA-directed DNA polymerase